MPAINHSNLIPTWNIGIYFYLIGSLVFFFQEMNKHDVTHTHSTLLILIIVFISYFVSKIKYQQ